VKTFLFLGYYKEESYLYIFMKKKSKKMANSLLNHSTLASVKTWGIQQERVICRHKGKKNLIGQQTFLRNCQKKLFLT
jgi:hypothetical protein